MTHREKSSRIGTLLQPGDPGDPKGKVWEGGCGEGGACLSGVYSWGRRPFIEHLPLAW